MILISCFHSFCDCLLRRPRKKLSRTYLESLKDQKERKFSSSRKSSSKTVELEPLEVLVKEISPETPLLENSPFKEPENPRESLLKLEKFYENNIKTLFETIITRVLSPFDGFERIYDDPKSKHNLSIHMKNELDQDKNRIFTYRTEWLAPCEPEFLMKFLNDYQEQIKLSDNKMEDYYPIKTFGFEDNFSIVYLKYKKILTYSQRDFCYLRCSQLLDKEKNIWVDCAQSISNDLLPEYEDIVRGNMLIHGYYIEPINGSNGEIWSKLRFYSQVDFKVSLPTFVSKTFSVIEMKKYVQKSFDRIEIAKQERN